ncbi:MAG TPA: CAP domain-containing protein [Actinomycetota bacterium]|nr:CAP domain-containing protein [Actinomycetota bacterium]
MTLTFGAAPALAAGAPASTPAPDAASTNFAWVNSLRAAGGLAALQNQPWAQQVAQAHSDDMANQDQLYHNMTGYMDVAHSALHASYLGENVGEGTTLDFVQSLLKASPEHYANIMNPRFNYLGVAVTIDENGQVWVTEDFSEIDGGSPAPAPAARPAAAIKPAVAPAPKPVAPPAPKPVVAPAPVIAPAPVFPVPTVAAPTPPPAAPASEHAGVTTMTIAHHGQADAAASRTGASNPQGGLLYAGLLAAGCLMALGGGFKIFTVFSRR